MNKARNITAGLITVTVFSALTLGSFLLKAGDSNQVEVETETEKTITEHIKFPKLILNLKTI